MHENTSAFITKSDSFPVSILYKVCYTVGAKYLAREVGIIPEMHGGHVRRYVPLLILFLSYLAICMVFFIFYEKRSVGEQTLRSLRSNVEQQCDHFNSVIQTQFAALDGLARFVARQDNLVDGDNLLMADAIVSTGEFSRILIIAPSGVGYANDGAITNIGYRDYFSEALSGKRAVSDPLSSSVDSETKVVLIVPVMDPEGQILGAVGGSFNIGKVSEFLFSGLYNGSGYPLLVTSGGSLVSTTSPTLPSQYDTIFDYCASIELLGGADADQLRQDFDSGSSGYFYGRYHGEVQYMVYQSAGLDNGWMMCYTVSGSEAGADFSFIFQDVLCLGAAFLAGVLLLLIAIIHISLRDRRRLLRQAQTDPLTGLLNRTSTRECINEWLSDPSRQGALLMLDLDNFKEVNDAWGHQAGDAILVLTADLLRAHFRQSDVIGRIGGDEFMVLMKDVSSQQVVEQHMHRLCGEFRLLTDPQHPQISISGSVGAAMVPAHGHTFEELYSHADHALYCAKHRGKDGWSVFHENPT